MRIREFVDTHYRHFNAASVAEAARAYLRLLDRGGQMLVTLAGAMSTAELGRSLAEMIRRERVHAICCTGANLEEDLFNLVAHDAYHRVPDWRNLTRAAEKDLELRGLNRVTDTCIPEEEAFRKVEGPLLAIWKAAEGRGERYLPHEPVYELIRKGQLADHYQIDPADSWLVAAADKELPLFVPGWEDSTLGNFFVSHVVAGDLNEFTAVRHGLEYMAELAEWYVGVTMGASLGALGQKKKVTAANKPVVARKQAEAPIGFFQIGGGIAGDFPICVVPMIHQDLRKPCPYWAYFCQISDSTTSYGSYSGAFPSEKITWGKLDLETPMYLIESDATIVAPLIFAYVLDW